MRQHWSKHCQRVPHPAARARRDEDEHRRAPGRDDDPGDLARDERLRRVRQPAATHLLADAGDREVEQPRHDLRRVVVRTDPGAAAGQHDAGACKETHHLEVTLRRYQRDRRVDKEGCQSEALDVVARARMHGPDERQPPRDVAQ